MWDSLGLLSVWKRKMWEVRRRGTAVKLLCNCRIGMMREW
jgi:hypothetical protein